MSRSSHPRKKSPSPRGQRKRGAGSDARRSTERESRGSVVLTTAWTVTVTTVLMCNVGAAGAHLLGRQQEVPGRLFLLGELLLFAGAAAGILSLGLLPMVYRIRSTPPPRGFAVFSVCVAASPLLALVLRAVR